MYQEIVKYLLYLLLFSCLFALSNMYLKSEENDLILQIFLFYSPL